MDHTAWVRGQLEHGRKENRFVSGLDVVDDFLACREEMNLLAWIKAQRWRRDIGRRVQHYGYRYDYRTRKPCNDVENIPEMLLPLITRLLELGLIKERPDQIIINEYESKQGIHPHKDHVRWFGPEIVTISLGLAVPMNFERGAMRVSTMLNRRSAAILKGDARYEWTHAIGTEKRFGTRYSITLRTCTRDALREMGVRDCVTLGPRAMSEIERKRKGEPQEEPEPKELRTTPTSPTPEDAAPPEASPNEEDAAPAEVEVGDAVKVGGSADDPIGTRVVICMEIERTDEAEYVDTDDEIDDDDDDGIPYEDEVQKGDLSSKSVSVWFPNHVIDKDMDKPFAEGKPQDTPPDKESPYFHCMENDYDIIHHVLMRFCPDGYQVTGCFEAENIEVGVRFSDERIDVALTDPLVPKYVLRH